MIPAELCVALCTACLAAGLWLGKAIVRLELRRERRRKQFAEQRRWGRAQDSIARQSARTLSAEETNRNRLRYEQRPLGPRDPDHLPE